MKIAFHCLAAAAFIMAGSAHAATVNVDVATNSYKGLKLSGSETLTLSSDVLEAMDTSRMTAIANDNAVATVTRDTDGYFTVIQAKTPITSLTIEDTTDQAQSTTGKGGLAISSLPIKAVSSGGSLTITDLKVDLVTKKVYATLIGANGVGTLTNYYMWDATTITPVALPVGNGQSSNSVVVSGLRTTTDSFNQLVKALGLITLGKSAFQGVTDYGYVTVKVDAATDGSGEPPTPTPTTCAVAYKATPVTDTTFDATVTISNSSTAAASDWKVNWTYGAPTLVLKVSRVSLTNTNSTKLAATPASTNKVVAAGGSVAFTFRAYSAAGIPAVSGMTATLGGQNCSVSTQ
jgi:hypothetical protein